MDEFMWQGEPMRGLCGHCQVDVDSFDPNHRVTSIVRGGRGVECVLRGDITPDEGGPLRSMMKQLQPGVYDDGAGGLHLFVPELLEASGVADTTENRAAITAAARDLFSDTGIELDVRP